MAKRMFAVVDVVELLRHWQAGDSVSQMARALGLDRRTVRKYAGRAEAAGMMPGGAPLSRAQWAERVQAWFPELTDFRARSSVHGQIAPFHDYIAEHIAETTLATIHQRLRDEHGLAVSIASLRRYVRSEFAEEAAEGQATVLRDDPPPGAVVLAEPRVAVALGVALAVLAPDELQGDVLVSAQLGLHGLPVGLLGVGGARAGGAVEAAPWARRR